MTRLLKLLLIPLAVFSLTGISTYAQNATKTTVKERMEWIEAEYGVNFVYDSSINMDIPYRGTGAADTSIKLQDALKDLFKGTGMEWDVKRKYIAVRAFKPTLEHIYLGIDPETLLDTLAASRITSYIDRDLNTTQTGLTRIDAKAFNRGFALLSAPDVIKTLQLLPGVAAGTELMSSLYVHGGDGSDNLFLLDGVPVYQVSHLLGLYSAFNTDAVESLDFYKSGFPARFGGRTSSVVDMATKQGSFDNYSGSFSIGLINAQMQYGGPIVKGKTSFNIALRHSWLDTISWPVLKFVVSEDDEKYKGRYALYDMNLNLTHKFSDRSVLSFNFYDGKDILKFATESLSEEEMRPSSSYDYKHFSSSKMDGGLKWGNLLGSLSWKVDFSPELSMKLSAYHTGTMGLVHYGYNDYSRNTRIYHDGSRADETEESTGTFKTTNRSRIRDYAVKADFDIFPSRMHHLRTGASYQYHAYRPERSTVTSFSATGERDTTINDGYLFKYNAHELSAYAEDEMTLTKRLRVNAGLRYTLYAMSGKGYNRLEPRLAMKYQFSDFGSFKLSYTHMNQFVHQVTTFYAELPTSLWMPSTRQVHPMHSSQISGGIYTDLPGGFHIDLEGWYKKMDHLLEYSGKTTLYPPVDSWERAFSEGEGRSYGLEASVSYTKGKMEASAGYTLSWTYRKFDDFALGWYPDRNDNRHKLNLTLTYRPTKKIELYAGWLFHSGSRVTIPTHEVERQFVEESSDIRTWSSSDHRVFVGPYNLQMAPYHRLDLGANFHHVTKRGNEGIWNISIYNAYCRMNPLFANIDTTAEVKNRTYYGNSFVGYSVIPIIPTFSYTLKF
ncbi:MAG: TonB-dependent receptor [Bacteroidales bacterium]|nr:TonB-dependent receptor [Bacteroidales bacterium]